MSDIPDLKAAATPRWRVRGENGVTFGPADLETLRGWARDGRLAPGHLISADGLDWQPVTRLAELGMDCVAEISPGTFYGPIHAGALSDLMRDGALSVEAPVFQRLAEPLPERGAAEASEQLAAEARLTALHQDFAARAAALENSLRQTRGELEQALAQLASKDLEFEAERQEFRAEAARRQAERARSDARLAALEQENRLLTQLDGERPAREARLADLTRQVDAFPARLSEARQALEPQLQQARQAQREAERLLTAERSAQAAREQETAPLREEIRALRLRQDSVRKLLQQALAAGANDVAGEPTVIEAEPAAGTPPGGPGASHSAADAPPLRQAVSLADLEAQAQRELRRLGNKGATLFARK